MYDGQEVRCRRTKALDSPKRPDAQTARCAAVPESWGSLCRGYAATRPQRVMVAIATQPRRFGGDRRPNRRPTSKTEATPTANVSTRRLYAMAASPLSQLATTPTMSREIYFRGRDSETMIDISLDADWRQKRARTRRSESDEQGRRSDSRREVMTQVSWTRRLKIPRKLEISTRARGEVWRNQQGGKANLLKLGPRKLLTRASLALRWQLCTVDGW